MLLCLLKVSSKAEFLLYEQLFIGLLYGDADLHADLRVTVASLGPRRGIPQCK